MNIIKRIRLAAALLFCVVALAIAQYPAPGSGGGGGGSSPSGGAVGGASNLTTVGAVPYVSAAGVLNQDASNFFWDATNHRLGIGTASPSYPLHINGSGGGIATVWTVTGGNYYGFRTQGSDGMLQNESSGEPIIRMMNTTQNVIIGNTSTDGNYRLDISKSGSSGTLRVYDQTATTGSTLVNVVAGASQTTKSVVLQTGGRVQMPLTTPTTSAETCSSGTITADTSFVYVCTAANTWKRAALAAF